MLKIRKDQMEMLDKHALKQIAIKIKNHLLIVFPNLENNGFLIKRIEDTLHKILKYNIETEVLSERFLELSVVYGWEIYKQQNIKEILEEEGIHEYLKVKRIEKILMEEIDDSSL